MPIQLSMMQKERRLIGTDIYIATWVAPDAEVPADMQSCDCWVGVLNGILKGLDICAGGDVFKQVGRLEVIFSEEVVYVAAVAAWVVAVAVCAGIGSDAESGVHCGHEGTEVDCQADGVLAYVLRKTNVYGRDDWCRLDLLCQRSFCDASTTRSSRDRQARTE